MRLLDKDTRNYSNIKQEFENMTLNGYFYIWHSSCIQPFTFGENSLELIELIDALLPFGVIARFTFCIRLIRSMTNFIRHRMRVNVLLDK